MNFSSFLIESLETAEIMRSLEEIEGVYQQGEQLGFDEDEASETFGSYLYVAATPDSEEQIRELLTTMFGYDEVENMVFYRMDTVVQVLMSGNEATFAIDHSSNTESYDIGDADYE